MFGGPKFNIKIFLVKELDPAFQYNETIKVMTLLKMLELISLQSFVMETKLIILSSL